ncbi:MAG TPA: BrnT family toxin [Planctomycetota bacterium]|nr:BrnT family toxin [Planctomycetota bacterium]
MKFTWNSNKLQRNLRKHGIHFEEAAQIFDSPMLCNLDERYDYGEDRWIGIGMTRGRCIVIVYTETGDDTIHLISARKALKHERETFETHIKDRLEAD